MSVAVAASSISTLFCGGALRKVGKKLSRSSHHYFSLHDSKNTIIYYCAAAVVGGVGCIGRHANRGGGTLI